MTKNIYITLLVCIATFANAQVSIGGKQMVEGTTTLLDFNSPLSADTNSTTNNNVLGIILPAVDLDDLDDALSSNNPAENNGTFLYDKRAKMVKMFEGDIWKPISEEGSIAELSINTTAESTAQHGAIIGSQTSSAKGVLILESPAKAMILPRIANPDTTVKNPYPGTMCYDPVTKSLVVFDGINWNYLK